MWIVDSEGDRSPQLKWERLSCSELRKSTNCFQAGRKPLYASSRWARNTNTKIPLETKHEKASNDYDVDGGPERGEQRGPGQLPLARMLSLPDQPRQVVVWASVEIINDAWAGLKSGPAQNRFKRTNTF